MEDKTEDVRSVHSATLQDEKLRWYYQLDKFGIETRGIQRVTPEERRLQGKRFESLRHFADVFGLWFAACGGLTSMSSFFLPTLVFGLDLRNALISGLVSLNFGCLVPAYGSIMGPRSGCRQMISARFLFGYWGVKLVALICVIGFIGWSIVNCVLGGEMFASAFGVKLEVGIVVISIVSLIVSIFGIKAVLNFQTVLSVPITIANILFYVVVFKKAGYIGESNQAIADEGFSSLTTRGNWLSFFTIGFSVTATWGGNASDYYVFFPEDEASWKVFLATYLGIAIPTTLVATVGTYCGSIALGYADWYKSYEDLGVGGLIVSSFEPFHGFGKFVVVVLYLSLICNNIVNNYSGAFDFQLIDARLAVIPRWAYAILITVVTLILSLLGKDSFSSIISNFLPMLGYWISIYIALLLEENLIFRSKRLRHLHYREFEHCENPDYLYNWTIWDQPEKVTHGLAAIAAFLVGAVGAVIGMNQVYWQGPVAKRIGEYGGDIGFFLCFAFAGIAYPIFRYLELKRFGK